MMKAYQYPKIVFGFGNGAQIDFKFSGINYSHADTTSGFGYGFPSEKFINFYGIGDGSVVVGYTSIMNFINFEHNFFPMSRPYVNCYYRMTG